MKKLIPTSLLTAALLFSPGCALLNNPTTVQRAATAAKLATYVGGAEYMRAHPETRPAFVIARDALWQLESAETIDFVVFLAIMNKLPIKELKSERASILITATTIILSDYIGTIPAEEVNKLRPLIKGFREGLDLALGQTQASKEDRKLFKQDAAAWAVLKRQDLTVAAVYDL